MATIPLVATSIRPPANPLDEYAKALSIKGMIQGQQIGQAQLTGEQLKNQQAEQDVKDRQATTAAMQEWDGKSYSDLPPLVLKHGGSSTAVVGLQKAALGMQEQKSTIAKNDAETGAKNLETTQKKNDMLLGHLSAVTSVGDDQLVSQLRTQKNAALLDGVLDPQHAAIIDHLVDTGDPKTIRDSLATLEKGLIGQKEQFDQAYKEREVAAKETEIIPSLGVSVNKRTNAVTPIPGLGQMLTPQMMESKYVGIQTKKAGGQQLTDDDKNFAKGYEKLKELIPQFNLNVQNTGGGQGPTAGGGGGTGTGGAKTLNDVPSNIRPQVQAVLGYRSPMPPQGRNNPQNTAIRQWVNALDGGYDETTFPQRNKILTEYVKSAGEGQIGAINTALGHLNELNDAAKALDQNDIPLLHSIASKVGAAFGQDAPSTYQMILHRVSPEMTSAYVKGGGGEGERGANQTDFDISKGASQIRSNIAESANLLNSKLASTRNNWENTFKPSKPEDHFDARFITPDAKAILNTLSGGKGSKSLSMAQIQQAAKDHNVSVEEATRQAKAAGYTVQ